MNTSWTIKKENRKWVKKKIRTGGVLVAGGRWGLWEMGGWW